MSRLTDNDRQIGPVTWGRAGWNPWRAVFSTGGDEDDHPRNNLTVYGFGFVLRVNLPTKIQPHRIKHVAKSWDAETVARMGRDWYYETFPREYGFSLHGGFLQVFHGPQTHDSVTTRSWCCRLPWTEWRHIRTSRFDDHGQHFYTEWERPRGFVLRDSWRAQYAAREACPAVVFDIEDYDGARLSASTAIVERVWRFGDGWFKWLSLFRQPRIHRSLEISFSMETGPDKGSWKGGTTGCSIEMLPGELHESAFRRYCEQEHAAKYARYCIKFLGLAVVQIDTAGASKA